MVGTLERPLGSGYVLTAGQVQRAELVLRAAPLLRAEPLVRLKLVLRAELSGYDFRLPLRLGEFCDVGGHDPSGRPSPEALVFAWPTTSFARRVNVPFVASA